MADQQDPQALQIQYNRFQETIQQLQTKIGELQSDSDEHGVVLDTLKKVPKERKCFRMVGGVLVEKTAGDVIPVLVGKLEGMKNASETLSKELVKTHKDLEAWKKKTNVKIVQG